MSAALSILAFTALAGVPSLPVPGGQPAEGAARPQGDEALHGLWAEHYGVAPGEPLRFYYFHPGGTGLLRYGRRGLNMTRSFAWRRDGRYLKLTWRRGGGGKETRFTLKGEGARRTLKLSDDLQHGGAVRLRFVPEPPPAKPKPGHPMARVWSSERQVGGRVEFRMYQLQPPDARGEGEGWFHAGDHLDWSTEQLRYRLRGSQVELRFPFQSGIQISPFRVHTVDGQRSLELREDPRDFWARRFYVDRGPSFMSGGPDGVARHPLAGARVTRRQAQGSGEDEAFALDLERLEQLERPRP